MNNTHKSLRNTVALFGTLLLICSCEDVIVVDVEDRDPQLVVEGRITDRPGIQEVILTQSAPYFSQAAPPPQSNATVIISELGGVSDTLVESPAGSGIYQTNKVGEVGTFYQLDIITPNGSHYRSTPELLSEVPPIDSIKIEIEEDEINEEDPDFVVYLSSTDIPDQRNFYQWKTFVNGELQDDPEELAFANDEFLDGNSVRNFEVNRGEFQVGDTVVVEQFSITEDAFDFLTLLFDQTAFRGSIFDTPPAPIEGNVTNINDPEDKALGYFMASGATSIEEIIEEQD